MSAAGVGRLSARTLLCCIVDNRVLDPGLSSMVGIAPLRLARLEDVDAAHAIRLAAAGDLTRRFGEGHWSMVSDRATLLPKVAEGTLYVAEIGEAIVGTVLVTPHRIAFYRPEWFADPQGRAAYMMDMSVDPRRQGAGIGRRMMMAVEQVARAQDLRSIRLDAYEAAAGAGAFYVKCGYVQVHRGSFRGIDLEYYEKGL